MNVAVVEYGLPLGWVPSIGGAMLLPVILAAFVLPAPAPVILPPPQSIGGRVSVFIGPRLSNGFADADRGVLDSIKDVQGEIQRSSQFTLVANREEATLLVEVLARRIGIAAGAVGITTPGVTLGGGTIAGVPQPTFTTPGITTMVPVDRHAIDWVLRVGNYEKATTSAETNYGTWKAAAKQLVTDLRAWAEANRAQLDRDAPAPASAAPQPPPPPPTIGREVEFDAFTLQPLSDNGYRLTATARSRLAAGTITHIRLALTLKDCTAAGVCEAIGQTETLLLLELAPGTSKTVETGVLFPSAAAPKLHHREASFQIKRVFGK